MRRQLLAPHPEIPAGFSSVDFRELQQSAEQLAAAMRNPRNALMSGLAAASQTIAVDTQRYTVWEARCEIIHRAIEFLENR
jgi:hypothetical protein